MARFLFIQILILQIISISFSVSAQEVSRTDSLINTQNRRSFKTYVPGIVALTYGVAALGDGPLKNLDQNINNRRNEKRPGFQTYADDYLRYVPYLALIGMEALGVQGKNELKDKAALMLSSATIAYGTAFAIKHIAQKERPNGQDNKSFPSGHATIAFAGAEMFNQEYGDRSPWYSIAGYTVASATSVLRVYNNNHWFSDVVAGAGVGILSTKLAYLIYPSIKRLVNNKNSKLDFTVSPAYEQRSLGFAVHGKF